MSTSATIDPTFNTVPEGEPFHCGGCGEDYDSDYELRSHQCPADTEESSVEVQDEDAILEALVVKASVPNLAALYQRGKEAGLIKPVQEYGTN